MVPFLLISNSFVMLRCDEQNAFSGLGTSFILEPFEFLFVMNFAYVAFWYDTRSSMK